MATTVGTKMMDKFEALEIFLLYALASISGGLGGCAAGARVVLNKEGLARVVFLLAYAVIGMALALVTTAYLLLFHTDAQEITAVVVHKTVLFGAIAGMLGTVALASLNVISKAVLKAYGIELQLTVRNKNEERRDEK